MLAKWEPIGDAPSVSAAEEVTEKMDVKGQERQPCDMTLVFRQARGTDRDECGARDPMREHMMPAPVGIDACHKREPVEIRCDSSVGDQEPVPSFREMLPYQPRNNEMTGKVQGTLPTVFMLSVAGGTTTK